MIFEDIAAFLLSPRPILLVVVSLYVFSSCCNRTEQICEDLSHCNLPVELLLVALFSFFSFELFFFLGVVFSLCIYTNIMDTISRVIQYNTPLTVCFVLGARFVFLFINICDIFCNLHPQLPKNISILWSSFTLIAKKLIIKTKNQ